jgi:hypothetical protein
LLSVFAENSLGGAETCVQRGFYVGSSGGVQRCNHPAADEPQKQIPPLRCGRTNEGDRDFIFEFFAVCAYRKQKRVCSVVRFVAVYAPAFGGRDEWAKAHFLLLLRGFGGGRVFGRRTLFRAAASEAAVQEFRISMTDYWPWTTEREQIRRSFAPLRRHPKRDVGCETVWRLRLIRFGG